MMKTLKILSTSLTAAIALTGCGKENPGNSSAYQMGSQNCSQEFVSDHNKVARAFNMSVTDSNLSTAESLVNDFSSKYAGVVCNAAPVEDSHLDSSSTSIDANAKVTTWRNVISSAKSQLHPKVESNQTNAGNLAKALPDPSRTVMVTSFTDGITIEIKDPEAFTKFVNTKIVSGMPDIIAQNGAVIKATSLDRTGIACYAQPGKEAVSEPKKGDKLDLMVQVSKGILVMLSTDQRYKSAF